MFTGVVFIPQNVYLYMQVLHFLTFYSTTVDFVNYSIFFEFFSCLSSMKINKKRLETIFSEPLSSNIAIKLFD